MGVMDFLKRATNPKEETTTPDSKYTQNCVLCNGPGAEEKWAGQYWHKKCRRQARKMGKKMVM